MITFLGLFPSFEKQFLRISSANVIMKTIMLLYVRSFRFYFKVQKCFINLKLDASLGFDLFLRLAINLRRNLREEEIPIPNFIRFLH